MALCTCCWKDFSPMRERVSVMPKFSFKKWRKNQCLCCSVKYSKYAKEPLVLDFQKNSKDLLDSWKNPEFRVGSLTQWFFKPFQNRFSDVWELLVKGIHIPYLPVPVSPGSKDRTSQHWKLEPITIHNLKTKEKGVCQLHHSKWKISWLRQALTKEKKPSLVNVCQWREMHESKKPNCLEHYWNIGKYEKTSLYRHV